MRAGMFSGLMMAVVLIVAACGGSSFNRDDAIDDLMEGGLDRETATCIVDGIEDNFSVERLESTGDLTDEETQILTEVTTDCILGGSSLDDSSSSDSSDSSDGSTDSSSSDSTDSDTAAEAQPTGLFSSWDFAPVCRGIGIEVASTYSPGDGTNPIVALIGEDPTYEGSAGLLLDGWEAHWEELDTTELVVCLNRTSTTDGQLCEGYEDTDAGLSWTVQTYGADYEVVLRDAQTAAEVATTTLSAPADDCPMFSFYTEGDPTPVPEYATPDDALEAWLAEYVVG